MLQNINELIAAAGPEFTTVDITVGAVTKQVRLRRLTFRESMELQLRSVDKDGKPEVSKFIDFRAALVASSVVDDTGAPAYTEDDVGRWPTALIDAIEQAIKLANGFGESAAKAIEKN